MDNTLQLLIDSFWPLFKAGLTISVPLMLVSFILGLVVAFAVALMRMSKWKPLKAISWFYVWVIRGTPLIVQIFIIFFGLAYVGIILASGLAITWQIRDRFDTLEQALRSAFFQVGSIMTTTGFSTVDFDLWPSFSKTILVLLMVVGACAGSTGGGVKVSRVVLTCKSIFLELGQVLHPHGVQRMRMDGKSVDSKMLNSIYIFLITYFLIFFLSILAVSLDGFNFETNFTAVAATLNNIGPGLAGVGPTRNFGDYSLPSKLVLIFDMLAGRLELLPMLILFYPRTWMKH